MSNLFVKYKSARFQKGFTLIEIMLAISITLIATIGVYYMLGKSQASAALEQEQKNISALAEGVQNSFITNGTYTGLTTELVAQSNIPNIKRSSKQTLISAYNKPVEVRPATVRVTDDAFDIEYQNLSTKQCLDMVNNLYQSAFDTIIDGQSSQHTTGNKEGSLMDSSIIISRCAGNKFKSGQGSVAFRFFTPTSGDAPTVVDACTCSPQTQTQSLSCPSGYEGSIDQERTSTCTGGTPSCRTPVWGSWTTTLNTCAPVSSAPDTCPPGGCVLPPPNVCSPINETRIQPCPVGQEGGITQTRSSTCSSPTATPIWSAWIDVQNTCQPMVAEVEPCKTSSQTRTQNCPAGQGGQILQERQSTCATSTSSPVWGSWQTISNNCSQTCDRSIASGPGSCCRVSWEEAERQIQQPCNAGQYGMLTLDQERERSSTCSSASASPTWPAWPAWNTIKTTGKCTSCPPNYTDRQDGNWVNQSQSCPNGTAGSITWQAEMARTRSATYNCPSGTVTLPSPTFGSWSEWFPTGNERNYVNTCKSCPSNYTDEQYDWHDRSQACPAGKIGSITWQAQVRRTRSVTYSCPAGTTTTPAPNYGGWSGWAETGATRNRVDTCENAPPPPPQGCAVSGTSTFTWKVGSNTCTASASNITINAGGALSVSDNVKPTTGSASFACLSNGTLSSTPNAGATCKTETPPPTTCSVSAGQTFNWSVGGRSCTAKATTTRTFNVGQYQNVTDSVAPVTGSAAFVCQSNGVLSSSPVAGATCVDNSGGSPGFDHCGIPIPNAWHSDPDCQPIAGGWQCWRRTSWEYIECL